MSTEPTIRKSTHDLAMLIASQVHAAQLPEDVERHYLKHKGEIATALNRGFILPELEPPTQIITPPTTIEIVEEHDLDWWLAKAQEFAKLRFGVDVDLRKRFVISTQLLWQNAIPVFDPGNLTNREMVDKVLKASSLSVYEEADVMNYTGSEADQGPTLHFIENSVRPNTDTMNKSPNQLRATGANYLRMRGYGLAFALYKFAMGKHLDPETFTWFPEDRLPGGNVACGCWYGGKVRFCWYSPDYRYSYSGARMAVSVPCIP
jgi:hypothetical protein